MHIMRERLLGGAVRPEGAERREIGSKRGLEGRENRLCGLKCWSECFRTIVGGDLEGIDGVFFNGLLTFEFSGRRRRSAGMTGWASSLDSSVLSSLTLRN